jgi:hypothetical protein
VSTIAVLAAGLAWLGASVTALSDARRGLALGLFLTGAGLAGSVLATRPLGAALLALSAIVAALLRLRDGPGGWGVLPAGSTPGIVLGVAVLVASLVLAGTAFQGRGSVAAVAPLAVSAMSAIRLLSSRSRQVALATSSALALALGALGGTGDILAGCLIAVALAAIPAAEAGTEEVAG